MQESRLPFKLEVCLEGASPTHGSFLSLETEEYFLLGEGKVGEILPNSYPLLTPAD